MNIETFLSHFDHVKAAGPDKWSCECPTHEDDDHKSLSIKHEGDKILMICRAGCKTEDVLAAKGLRYPDDLRNGQKPAPVNGREVCAYDYVDEGGNLLYQNVRLEPKHFYIRRPDGKGGWIKDRGDIQRTIYRLPAVIEAARAGGVADDARAARVPDDTRIPRTTDEPRTSRAPDDRRTVRIPDEPRPPRRPPTDRTPDRIPDRPPARRTPPDAPTRVPPGEPPRVPPRVPPPVPGGGPARALPRGVKVDKALKEPPTPAQLAGAVAWPQGFGWRVAYRNDGGRLVSRFYHGQDPPQGVKTVLQGKGEAARGIQQYKGGAPVEGTVNMGAVDITVKKPQIRPGARGAISFRATRITPKRPRIGR